MCEANVYLIDEDGRELLFLEAVDKIIPTDNGLMLENIFSERKSVKASIKEMTLVAHKIVLEKITGN